jgi:uncharacterized protein involved in exopolysaccharide biosynthesis
MSDDLLVAHSARATGAPNEIDLAKVGTTLNKSRKLILWGTALAGAFAFAATFLITPKFASTVRLMPPQQSQSTAAALLGSLGGLAGLAGSGGAAGALGLKNPADQWIGLLNSRTVADGLISRFDLRKRYDLEHLYLARIELDDRTNIQAGKDGLITIDVVDEDPEFAAKLANAFVDELRKLTNSLAVGEAAQRRVFFEQQLKTAKEGLEKADLTLQASGLNEGVIKASPEASVGVMADIQGKLAAIEVRISVMRGYLNDGSAELKALLLEQAQLRSQLSRVQQASSSPTSEKAQKYIKSVRDVKYYETLFEIMARQYEIARVDEAKDGALIQVVDPAIAAEKKATPKRGLITAIASALVMIGLMVYVLARDARRERRRDD